MLTMGDSREDKIQNVFKPLPAVVGIVYTCLYFFQNPNLNIHMMGDMTDQSRKSKMFSNLFLLRLALFIFVYMVFFSKTSTSTYMGETHKNRRENIVKPISAEVGIVY